MTTIATLVSEIKLHIRDSQTTTSAPMFTDDEIKTYLQRAVDDLCWSSNVNYRKYEYTHSGSDISSITFLTLTGNVEIYLNEVTWLGYQGSTDNYYNDLWSVDPLINDALGSNASSLTCEIYDDSLYFNRDLVSGEKILVAGKWQKSTFSLSDTFPLNSMCEQAVVNKAIGLGFYKKGQLETGDRWIMQWKDLKKEIISISAKKHNPTNPRGLNLTKRDKYITYRRNNFA